MATQKVIVEATQKYLLTTKKSMSVSQSLDLFTQVLSVDLGLKPALLYDANGASSEQVQQYLNSLQSSQLVSKSLFTLDLNENTLVVNLESVLSHLKEFCASSVAVVDVCHLLKNPAICEISREKFLNMAEELHSLIEGYEQHNNPEPLYVEEQCENWNLCTVFGLLLGYPVTYWFDQNRSFENCLSMTPLVVTTASATWRTQNTGHTSCLYSFSVPANLIQETQYNLKSWDSRLKERFQQQHVLTDLTVSQTLVTLPSVCL